MTSLAAFVALLLAALMPAGAAAMDFVETPYFAVPVAEGKLPPVAGRLPDEPSVVRFPHPGTEPGRHGGTLDMVFARSRDIRVMVVYSYARLVGYDRDYELRPDLLKAVEDEEGRIFTLHLRPGHRWSDGQPFTSEDFRYWWEDIANNAELNPAGPPRELIVDGEKPTVEIVDEHTVRYSWDKPNPFFLPELAAARPMYIYAPSTYLKQYHSRYRTPEEIEGLVKQHNLRDWVALHYHFGRMYTLENPSLPTLQPWTVETAPPASRFIFRRNPFYHRVDELGQQLPYIDEVAVQIANSKLIPAKAGAGESDLQARNIDFHNYTFLKQGEKRNGYDVRLWRTARGSHIALFPNLNHKDAGWRALFRETAFRRALSLGIDRFEINQAIYFGLAQESGNAVLPESPLHREQYARRWAEYDPVRANALLDGLGLTKRDSRGIRLLPDGRPMEIIVETAGESSEETDVLQLVHDSWMKLGIKIHIKPLQREVFRNRIFAGSTMMSVWSGLENGIPTADSSPAELAATSQQQLQWPKWGQHHETSGKAGAAVDLDLVDALNALDRDWRYARTKDERRRIWHDMLHIFTDQVYTIGIVSAVPQPVVVNSRLRNVPEKGVYNWDPGAHFGIYRPDTFWFAPDGKQPH
ncbi:MAG: ABC transporter substrate-binding protein [Acetobacterales bacterium]